MPGVATRLEVLGGSRVMAALQSLKLARESAENLGEGSSGIGRKASMDAQGGPARQPAWSPDIRGPALLGAQSGVAALSLTAAEESAKGVVAAAAASTLGLRGAAAVPHGVRLAGVVLQGEAKSLTSGGRGAGPGRPMRPQCSVQLPDGAAGHVFVVMPAPAMLSLSEGTNGSGQYQGGGAEGGQEDGDKVQRVAAQAGEADASAAGAISGAPPDGPLRSGALPGIVPRSAVPLAWGDDALVAPWSRSAGTALAAA